MLFGSVDAWGNEGEQILAWFSQSGILPEISRLGSRVLWVVCVEIRGAERRAPELAAAIAILRPDLNLRRTSLRLVCRFDELISA